MRRHLVTKGSFYERLADHGHEIVNDDDFARLDAEGKGGPSIPPSVMVRAMLCATHDKTSDAETSRRTRVDADWKAAMGVDDEFCGIAPRDLQPHARPHGGPRRRCEAVGEDHREGWWRRGSSRAS